MIPDYLACAVARYAAAEHGVIPAGDRPGDLGHLFDAIEAHDIAGIEKGLTHPHEAEADPAVIPHLAEVIAAARQWVGAWHDGVAATTDLRRFEPERPPDRTTIVAMAYVHVVTDGAPDPDYPAGALPALAWTSDQAFGLAASPSGVANRLYANLRRDQRLVYADIRGQVAAWYGADATLVELLTWGDGVTTVGHVEHR